MTADRLIAQARGIVTTIRVTPPTDAQINSAFAQYESIALALAAALEAAEAQLAQAREFGRAAVYECAAAEAQRDTLAEALRFYAENWEVDQGGIARAALAGVAPPETDAVAEGIEESWVAPPEAQP